MRQAIKSPQDAGLNQKRLTGGRYSHSIIYRNRNQLTENNIFKNKIQDTVLYTVTGEQYHEKYHATWSVHRTAFRIPFRLRLPGQRILPVVGFVREIFRTRR